MCSGCARVRACRRLGVGVSPGDGGECVCVHVRWQTTTPPRTHVDTHTRIQQTGSQREQDINTATLGMAQDGSFMAIGEVVTMYRLVQDKAKGSVKDYVLAELLYDTALRIPVRSPPPPSPTSCLPLFCIGR